MAFNRVIEVGRVASDLELKQTASGKSVCSFPIAVRKDNEHTDFFTVVAWERNAQFICQHFTKGDGIGIEGKLSSRQYEKDGRKNTVYEIVCDGVFFAETARKAEGQCVDTTKTAYNPYTQNSAVSAQFEEVNTDENLPF